MTSLDELGPPIAGAARPEDGRQAQAVLRDSPVLDERIVLMGLLIETHAHLARVLGAELEQHCGLPLLWFDVLVRLGRSPEQRMTMTQLAEGVSLTSGGITRLVDRMADAALVERQDCPSDRRSVFVVLTDAGRLRLHNAALVHLDGLERHLIGPLDDADVTMLEGILRKLRGNGPICGG